MSEVFTIVLPVFALIAIGYLAGRFERVGPATSKGIAEFTFMLAVPALMFRTMATARLPDVAPLALWSAYFGAALSTWAAATVIARLALRRSAPDSASIAMSAMFGNVVMLGIPLAISALGPEATGPIALVVSVHTPTLWLVASLHMAIATRAPDATPARLLGDLVAELARNSIIQAIVAGTLWRLTGLGLHPVVDKILALLGQAAVPTALVALGLSLVGFRIAGQTPTLVAILVLKLVAMPLAAYALSVHVLDLPPIAAGVVVIFAAMPTGANAFLYAQQYDRAKNSASGAVALGTLLSVVTASLIVFWLRQ